MPCQAGLEDPGTPHHVMIRGIIGKAIFRDNQERKDLVARLGNLGKQTGARILAGSLLSNHARGAALASLKHRRRSVPDCIRFDGPRVTGIIRHPRAQYPLFHCGSLAEEKLPGYPPRSPESVIEGLIIQLTLPRKSPLAPLFQRGVLFLPLTKGG
jgi:hypothetical protein